MSSLKIYRLPQVQDFRKIGAGWLLFGLAIAPNDKLLSFQFSAGGSTSPISSIEAVKIDQFGTEISRTTLDNSLISLDTAKDLYICSGEMSLASNLDDCIYYIEAGNGSETWQTSPFLVQFMESLMPEFGIITEIDSIYYIAENNDYIIQE